MFKSSSKLARCHYRSLLTGNMIRMNNTCPAHCQALQQRAGHRPPQTGPSVTSKCTSPRRCSSRTLQRTRHTHAHTYTDNCYVFESGLVHAAQKPLKWNIWNERNKMKHFAVRIDVWVKFMRLSRLLLAELHIETPLWTDTNQCILWTGTVVQGVQL